MNRPYYGWIIVASLFFSLTFTSGLGFYNHTVMLQALVAEKSLSVTIASTAVSVFFLASGFIGLVVARGLEKFDVRAVMITGALLSTLSLIGITFVNTEWQLLLVYAVFGVGFAASGLLPATTLVTRWFDAKRAMAMSIASTGLSVGGILVTPPSALLINNLGIDQSLLIFAVVYFLGTVPITLWLIRSHPADMGLHVDGGSDHIVLKGTEYSSAITQRYFWALSAAYIFLMLAQVGGLAHQYGIVIERLDSQAAALALGVVPAASITGRLIGGYLLGKISSTVFFIAMMLFQFVSLLAMSMLENVAGFIISLGLFGVSVGNLLMLQPLLIAEKFGTLHHSRIFGLSNMMTTVGIATGPILMGYAFTVTESYTLSYILASLSGLIGLCIFCTNFIQKRTTNP